MNLSHGTPILGVAWLSFEHEEEVEAEVPVIVEGDLGAAGFGQREMPGSQLDKLLVRI